MEKMKITSSKIPVCSGSRQGPVEGQPSLSTLGLIDWPTLNIFRKAVQRRKCSWQFKSDNFFKGMLNINYQVLSICLNLSRRASV